MPVFSSGCFILKPCTRPARCFGLLLLCLSSQAAFSASVASYPLPALYSPSTVYSLKVGGVSVPVVNYYGDYDYAECSVSGGPVTIEVMALGQGTISSYGISPKRSAITGTISANVLTFTPATNQYLIVQINGLKRLVIATDPGEINPPASSGLGIFNVTASPYNADRTGASLATTAIQAALNDASAYGTANSRGIVYLPAGVYKCANLKIGSNVGLYLAGGAVIRASDNPADFTNFWYKTSQSHYVTWFIYTATNSTNISVFGRGTVDANGYYLANTMNYGINFLVPVGCTNFTMDGITFRDSGSWGIVPARSRDLSFYNLKVFNHLNTGEDDGIDVCESQNVIVSNALAVALDDPYSVKTWMNGTDIAANWPGAAQPAINVVFDNCLSWTICYAFKVGQGVEQPQDTVIFRNSVAYDCAVGIGIDHKYGSRTASNITFDHIDIEKISYSNAGHRTWAAFFVENALGDGGGPVTNLFIRDINVGEGGTSGGVLSGLGPNAMIRNVTFQNILMPGSNAPAANLFQMNMTHVVYATSITILPVQIAEPAQARDNGVFVDFESPVYALGNMADSLATGATNATFIGQQGWSQSTSGGPGAIVATTDSGLYTGGQALGSGDSGNAYIGANTALVLGKKYRFDIKAPAANKAGVAGFVDMNHDGLFSQTESSSAAGVWDSGGIAWFGFRDQIAGGSTYLSSATASPTNWYRVAVTLDDATRTATMDVTNLTAGGTVVDLNGSTAGASFLHTWPATLWISPTNFVGTIGRASATLLIDNIFVVEPAVLTPIPLNYARTGTNLLLTWPRGSLLESTNLSGPWVTNTSATAPYTSSLSSPRRFYRLLIQ